MKLLTSLQDINKYGEGKVTLLPEEPEDMWHAYNLIAPRDRLRAWGIRRVIHESATGSTSSTRVRTQLEIIVTSVDFDSQRGELHVNGRQAEETANVKAGAYHTIDLELRREFTLEKGDGWDSVSIDVVKEAIKQDKEGVVPAIVMQEGLANICLITEYQTVLKQTVEVGIPKKRSGRTAENEEGLSKFYHIVWETFKRYVDISVPRPYLIASPGFTAAGFKKYVLDEANRTNDKALKLMSRNFIVVHSSSGHLHSLNEVLKSPEVLARLKDTKYAKETKVVDDFLALLRKDIGKAWYGPKEVEKAVEKGAVGSGGGTLLIINSLFRSQDIDTRKRWVSLVDKVKEGGGTVCILSSDHESGKRLENLGGIAAILTFPLEDLDESEDEDDDAVIEEAQEPSS